MPDVSKIKESELRPWTDKASADDYFRALVGQQLPSDNIPDDDLIESIVSHPLLAKIYDDLYKTPVGRAKVANAIRVAYPEYDSDNHNDPTFSVARRVVWATAVADPRFSLILKQLLAELRLSPTIVRASQVSGIAAILGKIRDALVSASAKHSNATLLTAILASLLAGGTASRLIPSSSAAGSRDSSSANTDRVIGALNNIAQQMRVQNTLRSDLGRLDVQVTDQGHQLDNLETEFNVLNTQLQQQSKQVDAGNTVVNRLYQDLSSLKDGTDTNTRIEKDLHQIAVGLAEPVPTDGLAVAATGSSAETLHRFQTIQANLNNIAHSFGIVPDSGQDANRKAAPTVPVVSLNEAIASARYSATTSYAGYIDYQAKPFYTETTLYSQGDFTIDATHHGQPCTLHFHLNSINGTNDASIETGVNDCGVTPGKTIIVSDQLNQPKRLPGSDIDLRFRVTYKPHFLFLKEKGAVISVFSASVR